MNYLVQPLLPTIVAQLSVPSGAAGLLVTTSQLGYLAGLLFLVPLGDLVDRRRLVGVLTGLTSAGLLLSALAPGFLWLAAALALVGLTTVVAQVLVPFVADLAGERDRGRSVGAVMAGLLLGVLLARTLAGAISELGGWRSVYVVGSLAVALTGALLCSRLPSTSRSDTLGYRRTMGSTLGLFRARPVLRYRAVYGAVTFAGFSVLWSTLALFLARPPYSYSDGLIGLFALVGAVGVIAAPLAGRISDLGRGSTATGIGLVGGCLSFLLVALGDRSLAALVAGIVLLNFSVPFVQILNQGAIYADAAGLRSRLTTAYMSCRFLGGAIGSATGSALFAWVGWWGACGLGFLCFVAGLAAWALERQRFPRPATSQS